MWVKYARGPVKSHRVLIFVEKLTGDYLPQLDKADFATFLRILSIMIGNACHI